MKFKLAILSLVICCTQTFTYAQQTSDAGELVVRVKSSDGPIEGAVIALTGKLPGQKLNVTNAEGVCDFRGLRPGTYSLQLIQRSFFPTEEAKAQMDQLEIQNGQANALNLQLIKGGVLKGRVVNPDGSPVIGMPVSALALADKKTSPPPSRESNGTDLSDDRGEFRIYGLRPGAYTVAVNAQRNSSPLKTFTTLFYPGERESANATVFELVAGQEMSIPDMVLDLTRVTQNSIIGLVRGTQGEALKGVSLSLISKEGSQLSDSTLSDYQGKFVFEGVSSGQYLIKASFSSQGYFNLERELSVRDLAANTVTLELKSYPQISGQALIKSKNGILPLPSFKLQLEPAQTRKDAIELTTDKDGRFSQRSNHTGSFWWDFPELPREYFINRILIEGKDITNRLVKLEPASDLREISVEVSTGAAEVRGTVPAGTCKALSVYVVGLDSKRDEIQFVQQAKCSSDSFSVQSLAPGRYYVVGLAKSKPAVESGQQDQTKQHGIADRDYDALDQTVKTLKARGVKTITLGPGQVHDNTQALVIEPD